MEEPIGSGYLNSCLTFSLYSPKIREVAEATHVRNAFIGRFFIGKIMQLRDVGGTYSYSIAGTNTLTQVQPAGALKLLDIHVTNIGGSTGYLQLYNGGSANGSAGTPTFTIPVFSGTAGAGTPTFPAFRDIFYPQGRQFSTGLSYLWSAGGTGTVAHGANAIVDITYIGTGF